MFVYESSEMKFDLRNILFRNLDKIFLLKHGNIYDPNYPTEDARRSGKGVMACCRQNMLRALP